MRARYRILVVGVIGAALVGCDPYPVPREPDHADLYVEFNSTGGAAVKLMLGGDTRTAAQLLDAGNAVAPVVFASHGAETVHINKQSPTQGIPFIEITAANVYTVGPLPVVHVDAGAALVVLGAMGYRSVLVDISVAGSGTATWRQPPDTTTADSWSWNAVVPGQAAPAGDITIVPPPASHAPPRNLAQAGWVAGSLVFLTAAVLGIMAMTGRRRRPMPTFNVPPGWPAPPPGWTPPAGWQPDPSWPAAPDDWHFLK